MKLFIFLLLGISTVMGGCKKLVQISEPINTITTAEAFSTDANAVSAIAGIYSDLSYSKGGMRYANGGITINAGLSADELSDFYGNDLFELNNLQPTDGGIKGSLWDAMYYDIYLANAALEGLQASDGVSIAVRRQLTGEAKFLRAFCHYYLVNLFGDVPLMTSTQWAKTQLSSRTPVADVYRQIAADLNEAKLSLRDDYSISGGVRARANKWIAGALLARAYLYMGKNDSALQEADAVIGNTAGIRLDSNLNDVFLKNNSEAIWQYPVTPAYPFATNEGHNFIPPDRTSSPTYYMTTSIVNAFEADDKRRRAWVDSTVFAGVTYYYPYKFKIRQGEEGTDIPESYTVLRLAEQYLIRAEAKARLSDASGATDDVNVIRKRAGLADLPAGLSSSQVLEAIAQENRIEFFAEWGHRWLDLKRTQMAGTVLKAYKGSNWQDTDALYPIPQEEIRTDPNLKQNPGYQQ